ncbi:MAG: O-succinylhomoserine sulfhydrylase [Reyranellaceae bacterium]
MAKKTAKTSGGLRAQTNLVHGGLRRTNYSETSEAIFMNSGYVYESAEEASGAFAGRNDHFIYSRFSNPTVSMFEDRLALLEGAEACRATATGMAAVFAALACQLRAGDRVVASRALFGSCLYIVQDQLPRWGIETVLVDGRDLKQWKEALSKPTKLVFFESPSNPTLEIVDIPAVSKLAHKAGARVVVDNVFSSPVLQKPLQLGADIVVYSATKHIDGQGRAMGGAILGSRAFVDNDLTPFLRHTGPAISPFNAWVMLKGLETLELRIARHCDNAEKVAAFLARHPKIAGVLYPTRRDHPQRALAAKQMSRGGNVVSFRVKGGQRAAFAFLNRLRLVDISNNLGDAKSLITHPATTTHQRLPAETRRLYGIGDDMLRLSVGLEDAADLVDDLRQALR